MVNKSLSYRLSQAVIYLVLGAGGAVMLVPFLHVLNMSVSSSTAVYGSSLMLVPRGTNLDSYRFIMHNQAMLRSFGITVFITLAGTALNLLFTSTAAYVLSKRELPGGRLFLVLIVITMVFNAGIIPGYILIRSLGLINSVWSMILPGTVNAFNLLLMRNFFRSVPDALLESAKIDGAGELKILFRVVIPLSLPAIATIGLFYGVGHWNEFFRGIFYITDPAKWPLQVLLRGIISQSNLNDLGGSNEILSSASRINTLTIQSAAIIFATIPVILVYPFLQKYFVKGIMLGAVKG